MLYMRSTSGNDGSYSLTVSFAVGSDPETNTVNVQNRVQRAMARLPSEVQQNGVEVEKKSSAILQVLVLRSPKATRDSLFLSNYVTDQHPRRDQPHSRRRPGQPVRPAGLCDAHLARHGPADRRSG